MPRSKEVDVWFARYDNPMKAVVLAVRDIILAADARMDECIKWQAPTFGYKGNFASFYPKSKQHASLMFHLGARIPGTHPRLEGAGDTSRVMKLGSVAEAKAAKKDLERLVKAWCAWRDAVEGAGAPPKKKVGATAKAGAKAKKKASGVPKKKANAKASGTPKKKANAKAKA